MEHLDLRVLIYSNPLVVDKIGKKFLYYKDSGFIYTRNLIASMPGNYRYHWLIPDTIKSEKDLAWFTSANLNVETIPYPYSTSIHQNRYEFYGKTLKENFPYTKDIDIIINNQPEVSANLAVWAENQRRDQPLIFSLFHWIDCEYSRAFAKGLGGYYIRQYEGARSSFKSYFHNHYAYDLFKSQFEIDFDAFMPEIIYGYFHPTATEFGKEEFLLPDKKIILFNHRLNKTTNWKAVVNICAEIYQQRQDFVLWMTDDTKIQEIQELRQFPFIILQNVPPENYGYLMSKCHFGVCNHEGYSTWNMAVLDAIKNGCLMVVPNKQPYPSMIGHFGVYHDTDRPKSLKSTIVSLLNDTKENINYQNRLILDTINFNDPIDIVEVAERRIHSFRDAKIEKYDLVRDFIQDVPKYTTFRAFKKDFVNKFWSFHVNSNFQKIRWKLLSNGVRDDTSLRFPAYYST